ncbi:MAG: hypothetical protein GW802_12240 [Armatimonadetes bacterium]|nr:hypothetical protein [Armatimonadota bacterium]
MTERNARSASEATVSLGNGDNQRGAERLCRVPDEALDQLIDRIAEAVVRKIDERDKIDAIAQAVLARLPEPQTVDPHAKAPARAKRPAKKAKPKPPVRVPAKKAR